MKLFICLALLMNLLVIICEIYVLGKIKKKVDILKYYTFLQNFLTLIVSIIFSVYLVENLILNKEIPEFIKGLRYIVTCGLVATTFIYVVFLSRQSKNLLSENDFKPGVNPKTANIILHYFCPIISLVSFVLFEKQIVLTNSVWTGYAAIPSCLYWTIYLILSVTNLWEEPYDFSTSNGKKKNTFVEVLIMVALPVSFILISYILWNIK